MHTFLNFPIRLCKVLGASIFMLVASASSGQPGPWSIETTNEELVEVHSRIWEEEDVNGDDFQIIEYRVTTYTDVSVDKLKALLYDADRHKEFMPDTEVSKMLERYSANEWLMYYQFDSPWPLPDSDCVTKMTLSESVTENWVQFDGKAMADLFPMTEERRMDKFEIMYKFSGEVGRTKLEVHSIMTPVIHAPDWLVNIWFPDGPAELVLDLIERAKI